MHVDINHYSKKILGFTTFFLSIPLIMLMLDTVISGINYFYILLVLAVSIIASIIAVVKLLLMLDFNYVDLDTRYLIVPWFKGNRVYQIDNIAGVIDSDEITKYASLIKTMPPNFVSSLMIDMVLLPEILYLVIIELNSLDIAYLFILIYIIMIASFFLPGDIGKRIYLASLISFPSSFIGVIILYLGLITLDYLFIIIFLVTPFALGLILNGRVNIYKYLVIKIRDDEKDTVIVLNGKKRIVEKFKEDLLEAMKNAQITE